MAGSTTINLRFGLPTPFLHFTKQSAKLQVLVIVQHNKKEDNLRKEQIAMTIREKRFFVELPF
jgi:hypothetical protein